MTCDLLLWALSLGAMSLSFAGPYGDTFEVEANQVGKEKPISSYGLVSNPPTLDSTARIPGQQRPSGDQSKHPSPSHGEAPPRSVQDGV